MIGKLLYGRKRRDRWWRYQVLKGAYLQAQSEIEAGEKEVRALDRALKRLGYDSAPEGLHSLWHSLVALGAKRAPHIQPEETGGLEVVAAELKPELLPPMCWLDLYRLCLGIGFFQPGRILREHGLARMILDAGQSDAGLEQLVEGCYAEVEQGNYQSARAMLKRMGQQGCSRARITQGHWFVELLAGEQPRDEFGYSDFAVSSDLEFGRFVHGKQIALVGPAPSKVIQGADIDRHQVVVKFGYRGGESGRDPQTQGERLDVSYYNNAQAHILAKSDFKPVFRSIRWAVYHNRKGRSRFPDNYPGLRQLASFKWLLPDTHFNAGPNAIIDLLRFSPARVQVFNTDLMLSSGRFTGYTPVSAKPIDYTRSFIRTHDPILQYQVVQRLWKIGNITGDDRFEEVMKMGLRCYLDHLQQAYGADERAIF